VEGLRALERKKTLQAQKAALLPPLLVLKVLPEMQPRQLESPRLPQSSAAEVALKRYVVPLPTVHISF
jgi:hypothetical protein